MENPKILVVDDEESILELLEYNLTKQGYAVTRAETGEDGLKLARSLKPDLILLDLMLPGIDGLDVCKMLKNDSHTKTIPIIMLTAKGEEADIVIGLELGADDYVTKPFSVRILLARVKAVIRRKENETETSHATPVVLRAHLSFASPLLPLRLGNYSATQAVPSTCTSAKTRLRRWHLRRCGARRSQSLPAGLCGVIGLVWIT